MLCHASGSLSRLKLSQGQTVACSMVSILAKPRFLNKPEIKELGTGKGHQASQFIISHMLDIMNGPLRADCAVAHTRSMQVIF